MLLFFFFSTETLPPVVGDRALLTAFREDQKKKKKKKKKKCYFPLNTLHKSNKIASNYPPEILPEILVEFSGGVLNTTKLD